MVNTKTESRVFSTTRKLIIIGKTAVGVVSSRQGREQGRKEAARGFPSSKQRGCVMMVLPLMGQAPEAP